MPRPGYSSPCVQKNATLEIHKLVSLPRAPLTTGVPMLDLFRLDLIPLLVRLGLAASLFGLHGLPKLMRFRQLLDDFPDPLGLGSPVVSLGVTLLAEVVVVLPLALGLWTRVAAFVLLLHFTAIVALVAWPQGLAALELPGLYGLACLAVLALGSGRLALDTFRRR